MNIERTEFTKVARKAGISEEKITELWSLLEAGAAAQHKPRFDFANVTYYFGALVVIGGMGWFMNKAWENWGGASLFVLATIYAACFILCGRGLWKAKETKLPGGLLFTIAVCMVPLATYGLERWSGFWPVNDPGLYRDFHPYINGSWLLMEVATVIAGVVAIRFWRFPFLTAPISYALWYMSMDLAAFLTRNNLSWNEQTRVSCLFGLCMLIAAYLVDLRGKSSDYAFWGYLFGLMAFWGGMTAMESQSELRKFLYCLINLLLILLSVALRRRAFIVFGSLGVFIYLGHLAQEVFEDSVFFPFALTLLGIGIIYLGLQYQRRRRSIEMHFQQRVFLYIKRFVPERAYSAENEVPRTA
jgi:hypothetical protein